VPKDHLRVAAYGDVDELNAVLGMARAARLDDPGPRIRLLNVYGNTLTFAGQVEEAEVHLRESLRLAEQSGDVFLRCLVRVPLTRALVVGGRLREAVAMGRDGDELGRDCPQLANESGLSPYGLLLVQLGNALAHVGQPADSARELERAMALARERRDTGLVPFVHVCQVTACDLVGEAEQALAHARRGVETAEVSGSSWLRALSQSALGHAYVTNGLFGEATEVLTAVMAGLGEDVALVESDTAALLAEAALGSGDVERALVMAETAIERARRMHRPLAEIRATLACARALLAREPDDAGRVAAVLDAAAALVERTGARALAPFVHVERARWAERRGDRARGEREVAEARRLFAEVGAPRRAAELGGGAGRR
jgi:tetratricopeptide (TPR) repeat protein